MKTISILIAFFFVAACGGRNGGGGDNGVNGDGINKWPDNVSKPDNGGFVSLYPKFPTAPVEAENARDLFNPTPRSADRLVGSNPWEDGVRVANDSAIEIKYNDAQFGGTANLALPDFKELKAPDGQSFYIASKGYQNSGLTDTTLTVYKENPNGGEAISQKVTLKDHTAKTEHTLVLGGKLLGLQHADFGIWVVQNRVDGELSPVNASGSPVNGYKGVHANVFTTSDPNLYTGFATSMTGDRTFKGSAAAVASNGLTAGDEARSDIVYGTATLTLNTRETASGSGNKTGKLIVDFKDFYKFTFINLAPHANIGFRTAEGYSISVSAEDRANKTGIYFDTDKLHYGQVHGTLLGTARGNPTEAVGTFFIDGNGSKAFVKGAFGAKR